jgi:hypothetical protein
MKKALLAVLFTVLAAPAAAQMGDMHKDVQVRQLEAQRQLFIAMADSMPARLYRDKATPIQRDFAGQLVHAVGAVSGIAGRFILGSDPGIRPDTAKVFNDPAAMKAFINEVYDWSVGALQGQSHAGREESAAFFGSNMPKWQIWDEIHQHSIWTAGQVVANFRKHGMAPPGFAFF